MNRKEFINKILGIAIFTPLINSPLLSLLGCSGDSSTDLREVNISDEFLKFIRPLNSDMRLSMDNYFIELVSGWLKNIVLGNKEHALINGQNLMGQFVNIRNDTNGYLIKIYNTEFLKNILIKSENVSDEVFEYFDREFSNAEIVFGNLFFTRQIRLDKSDESEVEVGNHFPIKAEEVYWLDVWTKNSNIVSPTIRVYWDSVGLISPVYIGILKNKISHHLKVKMANFMILIKSFLIGTNW